MGNITMQILTDELSNCTSESRIELLGNIMNLQNKASLLRGTQCENICINWNTSLFLQNIFHFSSVKNLENIFRGCKFVEDESLADGVINFE